MRCGTFLNDNHAKRLWRSLLTAHNAILGPALAVNDSYHCQYGSHPRCSQAMPSPDLFTVMEPLEEQLGFVEYSPYFVNFNSYLTLGGYTSYDLSIVLGHGRCMPAWLKNPAFYAYEEFGVSANDCANIYHAVTSNPSDVARVMKRSIQPVVPVTSPEEHLEEFPTRRVVESLRKSAESGDQEALVENGDARLLHCADSVGNRLCGSLRRVLSSEGVSFGFNAPDQAEVLAETEGNKQYLASFLERSMEM